VRIADDGEVLVKGAVVFRRYFNNDAATAEALTDGWFHTGDLGELDEQGFLKITGRKKEIIVTAGGKNVSPAVLEDRLRAHPLISQCMANGDAMRASDGDRERLVQALQEQVGEGRLTLAEFEQRTNEAYAAKTVGDLRKLTEDLPINIFPQPSPFGAPWQQPFPMPNIPAWQQRGGPPAPVVRVNPLTIAMIALVALSVAGVLFLHIAPFLLPMIFVFMLIRRGGGGGGPRRYPPQR